MAFSMVILSIILVGLNKLYYLVSTLHMYLHKYLLKHIYYYQSCHWHYIKHRQQHNVHVDTCHNSKWIHEMHHGNNVWHSEGIMVRYDFFVHVMIHTRKEHISMCTRRNVAILIGQIDLICMPGVF